MALASPQTSIADLRRYLERAVSHGKMAGDVLPFGLAEVDSRLPNTRESYTLALQSGARAQDEDVREAVDDDLVLAAALDASQRSQNPNSILAASLEHALNDDRSAVRRVAGAS